MCEGKKLQFTVPMDNMVLTAVGTMLLGLASALEGRGGTITRDLKYRDEVEAAIAYGRPVLDDQVATDDAILGRLTEGQCGCDPGEPSLPTVDAAAIFGGLLSAGECPGFAERTAHLNGSFNVQDFPPNTVVHPGGGAAEPLQPGQRVLVELDVNGLPWDRRIHASTKTKCADGSWKKARSVDPTLVTTVEAELRVAMSAPGPVVDPEIAAAQIIASPSAPVIASPPPASPVTPEPPVLPTPPAPTGAGPLTFPEFLQRVTAMCASGQTTHEAVASACQKHGLAGIPLLASRPDLVPVVAAELGVV